MSTIGQGGNSNFQELYNKIKTDKNITQNEAQSLVNEALKDGGLNKQEREALFEIGMSLEDKKSFDPSKLKNRDGYQPLDTDVKQMFDMGMKTRKDQKATESLGREAARYADDNGEVGYTSVIKSGLANAADGVVDALYSGAKKVAEVTGAKEYLKKEWKGTVDTARGTRDGVAGWNKDFGISDTEKAQIAKSVETDKKINLHKADKAFTFSAFENVQCVDKALTHIGLPNKAPKDKAVDVSEKSLNNLTGKNWDAVNISESKDLANVLKPNSLITDGGHAYVFKGIDSKTGKINVFDPSTGKDKTFSKDNKAITAFVQGTGDGNKTGAADATRSVMSFNNVKPLDEDNGTGSESFAIRKALVFMSDPSQSAKFNSFKQKIEGVNKSDFSDQSVQDLSNFLKSNGMGAISERDVRGMVSVLTAKTKPNAEMGGKENLLDMFDWLNNPHPSGQLTQNQTRVMSAVEYSNIDLSNYFSTFKSPEDKADKMSQILNEMMKGKCGC
ncbi:MAG: hypothetical protein ACK4IX_05505 [Candidatus Sericytochromatia bacterium]